MKTFISLFTASLLSVFPLMAKAQELSAFFQTHHDKLPHFAQNPTIRSVQSGSWSDPRVWAPARLPHAEDIVLVSHEITYATTTGEADTIGIAAEGGLRFASHQPTVLKVATLLVMPDGTLEMGTTANPIAAHVKAEIVIQDKPLDLTDDGVGVYDPQQWGTGLIVLNGHLRMHGTPKTPPFVRLAREPHSGDTTLILREVITGWQPGDRLILPDTRLLRASEKRDFTPQWEELAVQRIAADGKTIILAAPLRFDHLGARDADGNLEFLPHVGNLSRNVIIRSGNPAGTRGHTAFLHRSAVDVRYAHFQDLGRTSIAPLDSTTFNPDGTVKHLGTNQIARYPLHTHHLIGPANLPTDIPQFTLEGNTVAGGSAFEDRPKWGLVIHGSHYGLIRQNVVYNVPGAGIVTEDGSESFNVFEQNFTVAHRGSGEPPYGRTNIHDFGHEGAGFWFRSPNNILRGNVAANALRPGFGLIAIDVPRKISFPEVQEIRIPKFKGADPHMEGQHHLVNINAMPLREFAQNEAYGAMEDGLLLFEIGAKRHSGLASVFPDAGENIIENFRAWHTFRSGVHSRWVNNITLENLVVRSDHERNGVTGVAFQKRMARNFTIRGANIQGLEIGIEAPNLVDGFLGFGGGEAQPLRIENAHLRNIVNLKVNTLWSEDTGDAGPAHLPSRKIIVRNTRFVPYHFIGQSQGESKAIEMAYRLQRKPNVIQRDEVQIYNYNGVPGDNFQALYTEQHPDFIIPQSTQKLTGSPEAGLTNQENWEKYGIAIAGALASCLDESSRSEIKGFVCPIGRVVPPQQIPLRAPGSLTAVLQ